jgi:NAD(P)-dependent dehydrogenase (short-subunit alcohol dehydrogenase family)
MNQPLQHQMRLFLKRLTNGSWKNRFAAGASSSFSSFQPPPPNTYHAPAVYNPIPLDINNNNSNNHHSITGIRLFQDPNAVHVVTGASRSMGLQFIKSLLTHRSHPDSTIIACCRDPLQANALWDFINNTNTTYNNTNSNLSDKDKQRIKVQKLDVTSDTDIQNLASYIQTNANGRVDALYNIAGVLGDATTTPGPERNTSQFDRLWFQSQMNINAISPMMISAALVPFMKVSRKEIKEQSRAPSIIVNISARVGSIGDFKGPGLGWHSYRMSKAALNMGSRALAHELKRSGIWTISLYPGFTDTDMSVPFQRPGMKEKGMVFPVDFTVERMLDVVQGMEEEHSGGLYDWSGIALPF